MSFEVKIPSLGESVTEAVIGTWMKRDGEAVAADEPLLELESDKANMELVAESAGTLKILRAEGETVSVGDVVAIIDPSAAPIATKKAEPTAPGESGEGAGTAGRPAGSEGGRATPTEGGSAGPADVASGASTGATESEAASGPSTGVSKPEAISDPARVGPAVRRIAEEESLDLARVAGTGPGGRITKADALAAAGKRREAPTPAASAPTPAPAASAPTPPLASGPRPQPQAEEGTDQTRVPMSRLRQIIARRLVEAQHVAAILTTFNEVDLTAVQDLRRAYKKEFEAKHGVGLGYMSFFVKACCAAAAEVPELNAQIDESDVVYNRRVHVGVAVGTDRGLVVPVVKNADLMDFADVEKEIARLAGLARDNRLAIDDLAGATFTISNGGVYGSLLSTPILTPPQSGILGMHKIEKRPIVVDDEIVIRPMMYLALSYDHRIVDGQGAVTFLVRVKEALEDPARLLLGV